MGHSLGELSSDHIEPDFCHLLNLFHAFVAYRRFIANGTTIIGAPLLHTWGREIFNLQDHRKHLMYNYQLSHPESSVLFFPTNAAIVINHSSLRMDQANGPNAELKWSMKDKRTAYYLQRHLSDLKQVR